jgi:hypothetical protein
MVVNSELQTLALWVGIPMVLAGIPLWFWVLRGARATRADLSGVGDVVAQTEADGTVPPE